MKTPARSGLGILQLADGLAFNKGWFAPGEGPFTVLAKVATANALDAKRICQIFGKLLSNSPKATSHGRSLVNLGWLARNKGAPQLAANLLGRGLMARTERWTHAIASDYKLRYCPSCLSTGYQSAFCQIEGLARCPSHGDRLLAHCQSCGASTPPYAVTPEAFDAPLICTYCWTPYAPVWDPIGGRLLHASMQDEAGYERLGQWVAQADVLDVQWPDQVNWLADPRVPVQKARAHKRINVLGALADMVPLPTPLEFRCSLAWTGTWPLRALAPQRHSATGPLHEAFFLGRIAIYKSIRRQYARRFGLPIGSRITSGGHQMVWTNDNAMAMPSRGGGDPASHGFLAWRLRFEKRLSEQGAWSRLELFEVLLLWPVDWSVPDAAWGHFVHQCLFQDLAMSSALCCALTGLDYNCPTSQARWIEVVGLWQHRFGSHARPWPDGMSVLRLPATTGQPGLLYLIATASAACTHT